MVIYFRYFFCIIMSSNSCSSYLCVFRIYEYDFLI